MSDETFHNTATPEGRLNAKLASAAASLGASVPPDADNAEHGQDDNTAPDADTSATPAAEKRPAPAVADLRRTRRQLESELAELKDRKREFSRQQKALAAARAELEAAERLQREDPAEYIRRKFGGSHRAAIEAAYRHGQLPEHARATVAEAADLRRALRAEQEAKSARAHEAAMAHAEKAVGAIFADVVVAADLTPAEVDRVRGRALRWSVAYQAKRGRAPTVEELDAVASRWPEFRDFVASKSRPSAPKPAPKPATKASGRPKTLDEKIREAARRLKSR